MPPPVGATVELEPGGCAPLVALDMRGHGFSDKPQGAYGDSGFGRTTLMP